MTFLILLNLSFSWTHNNKDIYKKYKLLNCFVIDYEKDLC